MSVLQWDQDTERLYETGVDQGVLYPKTGAIYGNGVAWNGLISVSEKPSGAESNKKYADNMEYLNLLSKEQFAASVQAFMYPDEFAECDGSKQVYDGVFIGQQERKPFGLSYRTLIGSDDKGEEYGYKIHLVYGAKASPSQKDRNTTNETPDAVTFTWELTTTAEKCAGHKPVSHIEIDSTKADPTSLAELEALLYGTENTEPSLPSVDDVLDMFKPTPVGP